MTTATKITSRSAQAVALRVKNPDATVQVVVWVEHHEGAKQPLLRGMYRTAPDATTPKPRWASMNFPETLWPGRLLSGAVGTMRGFMQRKMSSEGPYTVEGLWALDLTDEEHKQLDALAISEAAADTNSFKTRVSRLFDSPAPRTANYDTLDEFITWTMQGPVIALNDGDVSAYTESVLKGPDASGVPTLTAEELADGIALADGKTTFIPRPFWGGLTDVTFLRKAWDSLLYVLLVGPPGTGKSALVEAAFIDAYKAAGLVFSEDALIMGTEDTTVADLIGGTVQDRETGIYHFRPGKAIRCAEAGVPLFIDEALLIDPRVLSVVYSLIDGRGVLPLPAEYGYVGPDGERDVVKAKPGFYVVFAGNPNVPGAVISEALASRCTLKPEYRTDYDTVGKLIGNAHDEIITVARNMDEKLSNGEVNEAPQMREMLGYAKTAAVFGTEVALSNLLEHFQSDSDREVCEDLIARTMGVSNIRKFRM